MSNDRYKIEFAKLATSYYVLARLGLRARTDVVVSGNLLHHAVEMYIKAALVASIDIKKLAKHPYGHNLLNLWKEFKSLCKTPPPLTFDQTIDDLHAFETIRYPEKIIDNGMTATIPWATKIGPLATPPTPSPPHYEVVLNEIDELVIVILERASLSPRALNPGSFFGGDALLDDNPQAEEWSPAT